MPGPDPTIVRAPEGRDRLTGLADRDRFARAIDQADADRDRLLVAVLSIDGLAEVNQLCGHRAGDDLLHVVAAALADRASVDVTPARIGGNRFAVLWAPADDEAPERLAAPVVADVDRAIHRWTDDLATLGTPSPVAPQALVGLAAGFDGRAWTEAELALDVAAADTIGPSVVAFDHEDLRVAERRRRDRVAGQLIDAVEHSRLALATAPVDRLTFSTDGAPWLRLGLHLPSAGRADDRLPASVVSPADLASAPGLAAEIDRRLLDRAADLLNDELGRGADSPRRVSVPLIGPLLGRRSALEDRRTWPPGVVIEVDHRRLRDLGDELAADLAQRLTELGWELAMTDVDGGVEGWRAAERLAIHHLVPSVELVAAAIDPGSYEADVLAAVAAATGPTERCLIAPILPPGRERTDEVLVEIGFDAAIRRPRPA